MALQGSGGGSELSTLQESILLRCGEQDRQSVCPVFVAAILLHNEMPSIGRGRHCTEAHRLINAAAACRPVFTSGDCSFTDVLWDKMRILPTDPGTTSHAQLPHSGQQPTSMRSALQLHRADCQPRCEASTLSASTNSSANAGWSQAQARGNGCAQGQATSGST